MRVLLVLHPDFTFPCTLNDFPLSEYIYPWFLKDSKNEIIIAASNSCRIDFSNADQIAITRLPSFNTKAPSFINKLNQLYHLDKIIKIHQPDFMLYDGILTKSLFSGSWLKNLFSPRIKKVAAGLIIHSYNRNPVRRKKYSVSNWAKNRNLFSKDDLLTFPLLIADHKSAESNLPCLADISLKKSFFPLHISKSYTKFQESEKISLKQQVSEGYEYFLCTAAFLEENSLIQLLKSFSVLKKRCKTNIKLVLAGVDSKKRDKVSRIINSYKYRADLILLSPTANLDYTSIIVGAYAHIFPSSSDMYPSDIWGSIRLGIPVILPESFLQHHPVGCRFDETSMESLAEKMMMIYKDESFRTHIIHHSRKHLLTDGEFEKYLLEFNSIFPQ